MKCSKGLASVLAFGALGYASLISQALFLREFLAISFGNELTLGIALALWFFGISLGAFLSGRIGAGWRAVDTFAVLLVVIVFLGFCELLLIRSARLILDIPAGQIASLSQIALAALIGVMPFGFAIGWAFPSASRLIQEGEERNQGLAIGKVYILEALGALAGGIAFTFVFLQRLSATEILSVSGIVLLIATVGVSHSLSARALTRWGLTIIAFGFIFLSVTPLFSRLERLSEQLRWQGINPDLERRLSVDSKYQHLDASIHEGQLSIFANGQFVASYPDEYSNVPMTHLTLAVMPEWNHSDILVLGAGSLGMLPTILDYDPRSVTIVELDDQLIELVGKGQQDREIEALSDSRITLLHRDGRKFLQESAKRYDLIVLSLPEPSNAMLNRYYTVGFFNHCLKKLQPKGVLVLRAGAGLNTYGSENLKYIASVHRTLTSVFDHVKALPLDSIHFFASQHEGISVDLAVLKNRFRQRWSGSGAFAPEHLSVLVDPHRIAHLEKELQSVSELPVNTDTRPMTYFFNLLLWEKMSGGPIGAVLNWIKQAGWWFPAGLYIALCVIALILVRRHGGYVITGGNTALVLAIGATGLCGMAWDLILLYAFQNTFGYLYHWIGLVVAFFMAGLALGGLAGNRLLRLAQPVRALIWAEVMIILYSAFLAFYVTRT
ncbi:spermidine synthase, partial [Acidobacteriota bacterium]